MATMTKEEYERWWSDGKPILEGWYAVPCDCGFSDCPGWRISGPEERAFYEQFSHLMEPR